MAVSKRVSITDEGRSHRIRAGVLKGVGSLLVMVRRKHNLEIVKAKKRKK